MRGKVKWWNDGKGYGFIEIQNSKDIFAHYSEIQGDGFKTLRDNQEIEFDLYEDSKGLLAKNIRKV
jgi:CspA family cold shock protein